MPERHSPVVGRVAFRKKLRVGVLCLVVVEASAPDLEGVYVTDDPHHLGVRCLSCYVAKGDAALIPLTHRHARIEVAAFRPLTDVERGGLGNVGAHALTQALLEGVVIGP